MKGLKKWLMALMTVFILATVATGCSNAETDTDDTNTEENQDAENTETGTEESEEETNQ